ncbi:MAG: DNA mismatch repair endonuclease MutL [Eubacteriales bacterium]
MGKINLLSFEVANLIAAGEVVDRPASAVKELLENAIDSGAHHITLEIQRGGVAFIRVADDGCGIEKEDLAPAIKRHSTSKIKTADDLGSITTLGFRGEALAAIASVSRLRIYSKVPGSPLGALLEADGGRIKEITDTGCREGTTVIAEDLFYNVPARRKFLKKDSTEATAIGAVVEKIALSHPEISMKFISDGEIKFMTSGSGDLRETIWALFGKETAARSLKADREENGIRVSGYVSEPDLYRSNRNMENFFINGRYIKSKTASAALEQAYSSKIPQDKFPFCVLNISLNPAAVDVNVHPAKLEVKFANEKVIFDAVYYAVLTALEAEAKRPELELHQKNPEKAPAKSPFVSYTAAELQNALRPLDKKAPKSEQVTIHHAILEAEAGEKSVEKQVKPAAEPSPDRFNLPKFPEKRAASTDIELPYIPKSAENKSQNMTVPQSKPAVQSDAEKAPASDAKRPVEMPLIGKTNAEDDPYAEICSFDPAKIPEYIIIGEAFNTYVIVQIGEELLMIDKHAAHERIIFDELCRKMRSSMKSGEAIGGQMLLAPIELELLSGEVDALGEHEDKIKALGFDYTLEKSGASSYRVSINSIPDTLDTASAAELFSTLASKLSDVTASVESAANGFFETRLWQASCKAAIKGGRVYDMAHIRWICDRLLMPPGGGKSVIRTCPHGRPVAFEIKKSSIDRQFARLL